MYNRDLLRILQATLVIYSVSFPFLMAAAPYRSRFSAIKCKDTTTGRELFIGEEYTRPGQCVLVQCLGDLQLWEDGCQQPVLRGNCTPVPPATESLDYPHCCPLFECKTYQTTPYGQMEDTRTYNQYGKQLKSSITQVVIVHDTRQYNTGGTDHKVDAQFVV